MARVYVSIGSNIEREHNIRSGIAALRRHFGALRLSSVYDSQAVGFAGENFYNLVAGFDTAQDLVTVVDILRQIEDQHQRRRDGPRFSSRTLDIDLLLYDDVVMDTDELILPRSEISYNAFVLGPLAEIAGDEIHPLSGLSYATLWRQFDQASQPMQRLDFAW